MSNKEKHKIGNCNKIENEKYSEEPARGVSIAIESCFKYDFNILGRQREEKKENIICYRILCLRVGEAT